MKLASIFAVLPLLAACAHTVTLPSGVMPPPLPGTKCYGHVFVVDGVTAVPPCEFILEQLEEGKKRYAAKFGPAALKVDLFALGVQVVIQPPDADCVAETAKQCKWGYNEDGSRIAWVARFDPFTPLVGPTIWIVDPSAEAPRPPDAHTPYAFDHEAVHAVGWVLGRPGWEEMEHGTANDPFKE